MHALRPRGAQRERNPPTQGEGTEVLDEFRVGNYARGDTSPVEPFIAIRLTQFARIGHHDVSVCGTRLGDSHRPLCLAKYVSRHNSVSLLGVQTSLVLVILGSTAIGAALSAIAALGARWRHGRETRVLTAALEEERKRIADLERRVRDMP